jgi:hypothetical protein
MKNGNAPLRKLHLSPILIFDLFLVGSLLCCCQAADQKLTISNAMISVTLDTANATFSVTDNRTGLSWRQKATDNFKVLECKRVNNGLQITCRHPWYGPPGMASTAKRHFIWIVINLN